MSQQRYPLDDNERLARSLIELRSPSIESTADSSQAYDTLHNTGYLRQRDSFYKWLLHVLEVKPGRRLLDISCGQGALVQFAHQTGLRASGLDLSPDATRLASQQTPAASLSVADATRLPYGDSTFDYVTNVGSLEHYFAPHDAIQEMARVLRLDGTALVLTPNTFGLLGNILHVWRTGDVFDDGQPLQRYGTNAQWRRLLTANGLQVEGTLKYERALPRTWDDLGWYALHPHRMARVVLSRVIPLNLSSFLVYLCSKSS